MQDIHQILAGGSGGPIFADRRLRSVQQAIKCPRCDSSSTKFCYYNNYNLSQPRHFCKNCRRYWTNGGVLRNVPVGGGCRKTKRSSKRKAASPSPARSSTENTSAKAKTTGSGSESFSSPILNFSEQPPLNYTANPEISVASANPTGSGPVLAEIGGVTSFVSGNQSQSLFGFGLGGGIAPSPFRIHHQNQVNHNQHENSPIVESWRMEKLDGGDRYGVAGVLDQTVQTDLVPSCRSTVAGVLTGGDWGGERSHVGNLFDLTAGNWSQSADQWHESDRDHDHDHHLYLPP